MYSKLTHKPINWIDGMKINKQHFIHTQQANTDAIRDSIQTNRTSYNYGLLANNEQEAIQLSVTIDNQNLVKVKLTKCDAITSGGIRIYIDNSSIEAGYTQPEITHPTKTGENGLFWISISVDPYNTIPLGIPDTNENPPRLPYCIPAYQLHVTPDTHLKQIEKNPHQLIIGKVTLNGAQSRADEEYIPPCTSISAHLDLISFHAELDSFFSKLELKSSQIVQKIFKKNQQNELSELVMYLCERMVMYLGSNITSFRWINIEQPPIHLVEKIVTFARIIKNTIDLRIGSGKEEMLNYLAEWSELNQGELENLLTNIANIQYIHHDINQNISKIIQFVKVIGKLFETLSNLEFIGKKKDSNIFVKEDHFTPTQEVNAPKPKRRFFGD